jgi:Ca2+-dependent lipid-binding protein
MAVKPGELVVKCIGANLTRDTEWMGKMSPFLVIEVGPTRRQTGTHHRGGKTPVWGGEILKFQITNDPEMKLAVWDEEKNKKHDLVGDTIFFLNRITNDNIKKEEIEITYKGKSSGKIMLEFEFVPNTVT